MTRRRTAPLAVLAAAGAPVDNLQAIAGASAAYHPGRSARLSLGPKNALAEFGELHPSTLKAIDLGGPVVAAGIAVHGDALATLLDLFAEHVDDLLVGQLPLGVGDLDGRVVRHVELGPDLDGGAELRVLAVLEGVQVEVGRPDDLELLGLRGLGVELREELADRLLHECVLAQPRLQHPARDPPRPEARHLHLRRQVLRGVVDGLADTLGLDGDGQFDGGFVDALDGGLHMILLPRATGSAAMAGRSIVVPCSAVWIRGG
ncbi:MAG: hypothetical protein KY463_16190, partial [Actinobacteria bacterium]|nr:hypothetical protein [Actinomycetota bacterium]